MLFIDGILSEESNVEISLSQGKELRKEVTQLSLATIWSQRSLWIHELLCGGGLTLKFGD